MWKPYEIGTMKTLFIFHPKRMMLLTKELLETFKKVGIQEDKELHEVQVIAKFFHAYHHRTRYATEYDPETETFF